MDAIIYAEVHLMSQRKARLFLRTIRQPTGINLTTESRVQPRNGAYFALLVKSAYLCPDLNPSTISLFVSACPRVEDFTYWPVADNESVIQGGTQDLWNTPNLHQQLHPPMFATIDTRRSEAHFANFTLQQISEHTSPSLSPRRLSLRLHEGHPMAHFRFIEPRTTFFSRVTHLSLANRWEEWTSWATHLFKAESLPSLKYLKLELTVESAPKDDRLHGTHRSTVTSTSAWLQTVTGSYINPDAPWEASFSDDGANASWDYFTTKMDRVAGALSTALSNSASLKVCVLLFRYDSDAARTARVISRLTSSRLKAHPGLNRRGFDPRLVFAWEKEPFRYPYAHSTHERMIWKSAEAVAKAQRHILSYTVLDCDRLI
ncbi:hypothetical protein CVT26_008446 [Gymnopilus dilepis]|uniref:Uncharacterized protein n=1 Tax=Gymnopilus dilepis TaxID=231916 RepID=A0A409XXG8_9AGAR|nr:hypothetical protein CVT26_008446 [Gymnopilus dilepis]